MVLQINATPLLAPSEVDAKKSVASFRISLPLAKLQGGRYTLQTIVIAPGTQHSAFSRTYMALLSTPPHLQRSTAPASGESPKPQTQ